MRKNITAQLLNIQMFLKSELRMLTQIISEFLYRNPRQDIVVWSLSCDQFFCDPMDYSMLGFLSFTVS